MRTLKTLIGIIFICCMFVFPGIAEGTVVSECKILDSETIINSANTTAYVDTINHEIRLPEAGSFRKISFAGESYDYVVLTEDSAIHYSFNGEEMVENPIASVNNLVNPLSVFSAAYPDVIVSTKTQVTHYSFTGTDMTENPALSIAGLTSVVSIASRNNDISVLQGNQADYYAFDGLEMANVPNLSIGGLNNPVEVALFQDTYDAAVLEQDKVRFYYFTGTEMTEAPDLALSGFANPLKSISVDQGTVSIIEGNQVKTYLFDGSEYSYVDALSITDSLSSPSCLALRPGSRDMIIVDNNEVKYFMFDGDELVYNPSLSKQIADFSPSGYVTDAVVQSILFPHPATASKVTAQCEVPSGTSITWSVYTGTWTPVWRIRGAAEPVIEYTSDAGTTWMSNPKSLWKEHGLLTRVGWKAELHTSNPSVTPKIKASNPGVDTAILFEKNEKPTIVLNSEQCYLTMTPTISWTFTDDDGDIQAEYDFKISNEGNVLYSYTQVSDIPEHTMLPFEDPAIPSPFWNSGLNSFKLSIRASDGIQWSDWVERDITFRAFERPRVGEVSVPGEEYAPPELNAPETHEAICQGMGVEDLPVTKAGGRVTVFVDSIGKVNLDPIHGVGDALFPYLEQTATVGEVVLDEILAGPGGNKRWKITFWTEPGKALCPDDTVVGMELTGDSEGHLPEFNIPNFADGIVRTKGTVYDNWNVVLQGR
jgi:hypothetical protein